MVDLCQVDRLPDDLLCDVLHRAAVRLDCTDAGLRALDERWTNKNSRASWAQVRELCRLQEVSKRFQHVTSTVKNLHCRISPLNAEAEILGLATFLSRTRCAGGLALTLALEDDVMSDEDGEREDLPPGIPSSIFRDLAESKCFEQLFL